MTVVPPPELEPLLDDPDDYRPDSRLGLVVDPGSTEGDPPQRVVYDARTGEVRTVEA
jgi:hypothetical protein